MAECTTSIPNEVLGKGISTRQRKALKDTRVPVRVRLFKLAENETVTASATELANFLRAGQDNVRAAKKALARGGMATIVPGQRYSTIQAISGKLEVGWEAAWQLILSKEGLIRQEIGKRLGLVDSTEILLICIEMEHLLKCCKVELVRERTTRGVRLRIMGKRTAFGGDGPDSVQASTVAKEGFSVSGVQPWLNGFGSVSPSEGCITTPQDPAPEE